MTYKKVKAEFKYAKDRLYRVFLIRSDISMFEFGVVIGTMFRAAMEHTFSFHTKETDYYMDMQRPYMKGAQRAKFMSDATIEDLGSVFEYTYDPGDGWDFKCRIYKKEENRDSDKIAIFLEGKGQAIWEDNMYSLMMYLEGKVDPKFSGFDEAKGIFKPWNVELKKFGDFDRPLNMIWEQKLFEEDFDDVYAELSMQEDFDEEDDIDLPPMGQIMEDFREFLAEKYGIDIPPLSSDNNKIVELFPDKNK